MVACVSVVLVGCKGHHDSSGVKPFRLERGVTTGVANYVLENGHREPIRFSANSEQQALLPLVHLKPEVSTFPTNCIWITGRFVGRPKVTMGGAGQAAVEKYREFELRTWWLELPFIELVQDTGDVTAPPRAVRHAALTRDMFVPSEQFDPQDTRFDPTRFAKDPN